MKPLYLNHKLKTLMNSAIACNYSSSTKYVNKALGGKSNFEKDFQEAHIETTYLQKVLLGLGSGFMSITDPRRGDMVAVMGESTGELAFKYIRSKMLESEEGRKILEEKPRISSASIDLEKLKEMPEGSLGKAYSNFLERYKYSPDERPSVRFVDDIELAYVATRYREAHDLFHTILDMPTNMLGEVTVKWVEAIQTKLPMCITGAFFGPLRLAPKCTRSYSTRVTAVLDSDIVDAIKSEKIDVKKSPWKMNKKMVAIPEHIQENIMSILEKNDGLELYKSCKKFKNSCFRRTLPVEGLRKQILTENFKNKLLAKVAFGEKPPRKNINEVITRKLNNFVKSVENLCLPITFDKRTGLIYLMSRAPFEYAALVNVFKEIMRNDPNFKPSSVFDFGSGVGSVAWAAKFFWGDSLNEYMTVDASEDMNELAYNIIQPHNKKKPFVKNLIQKRFMPHGQLDFDLVVSSFTFFDVGNYEERMKHLCGLWNLTSKYLVILENGTKDGFQIIHEARDMLLQQSESMNFKCKVVSPCPHSFVCPMAAQTELRACSFISKFQELNLNEKLFHGNAPYSYVIFTKDRGIVTDRKWPRIVKDVVFRKRQVICNFCTADGKLEKVIISKGKYDPITYKCAKALKWGDFLPGRICHVEKKKTEKKDVEMDDTVNIENKNS